MKYYAIGVGTEIGIYSTWEQCKTRTHSFTGAKFKSFDTLLEAKNYIKQFTHDEDYPICQVESSQKTLDSFFFTKKSSPVSTSKYAKDSIFHKKNSPDDSKQSSLEPSVEPMPNQNNQCIYTNGACVHNETTQAKAGIGVYYGAENDKRNVSETFEGKQTKNIAKVKAVLSAYHQILKENDAHTTYIIYTDSQYTLGYATHSGEKHHKQNWKKNIPNKELVKELYQLISSQPNIQLKHIKAHTNHKDKNKDKHSFGNEQAEKLSNRAIGYTHCPYDVSHRIYLNVPYSQKDVAKQKGCKWDKLKKQWWSPQDNPKLTQLLVDLKK